MAQLRIGDVAAQARVTVDTVRFYERRGLLPRAARTAGKFRVFSPETVERLRFIKQAKEIGLSLAEIKELLSADSGAAKCRRVSQLLQAKLDEIDQRIETMKSFRRTLSRHLATCMRVLNEKNDAAECPVVSEIAHTERT